MLHGLRVKRNESCVSNSGFSIPVGYFNLSITRADCKFENKLKVLQNKISSYAALFTRKLFSKLARGARAIR